jgi:hypothetical protein
MKGHAMTIDTLIQMLEQAKGLLPSGGQARVIFRDGLLVRDAYAQEALDAVVLTDAGDKDKKVHPKQQREREEDPFDISGN